MRRKFDFLSYSQRNRFPKKIDFCNIVGRSNMTNRVLDLYTWQPVINTVHYIMIRKADDERLHKRRDVAPRHAANDWWLPLRPTVCRNNVLYLLCTLNLIVFAIGSNTSNTINVQTKLYWLCLEKGTLYYKWFILYLYSFKVVFIVQIVMNYCFKSSFNLITRGKGVLFNASICISQEPSEEQLYENSKDWKFIDIIICNVL